MEFGLAFPTSILVLLIVAVLISSIGYYKFIYFISIGYGIAIAGCGITMVIWYRDSISLALIAECILLVIYGFRLGGFLIIREIKSSSYRTNMKNEIKSGSEMSFFAKFFIWISVALLYVMQVSPVCYRLESKSDDVVPVIIGCAIMILGMVTEAVADAQKSKAKAINPKRFCDSGLFKIVRCPNYFGEVLVWTGVFVSGVTNLKGAMQWVMALGGYLAIVYIMIGGARRLEIRQNKNYGDDSEYQEYVKTTPILFPLLPLYSVEKYTFFKG